MFGVASHTSNPCAIDGHLILLFSLEILNLADFIITVRTVAQSISQAKASAC
jgi:hypothetical protein